MGTFIDSKVVGINYKTETQSGQTDENGQFKYISGESVTFSVGQITLPTIKASETITPLHLANTSDPNNQVAVNILVFLQTINQNTDATNGIAINQNVHNSAVNSIDFTASSDTFATNTNLQTLITKVGGINKVLVSEEAAKQHFINTLNGNNGTIKLNIKPVAEAGQDQASTVGTIVSLSGSSSKDANGDSLSYKWIVKSRPDLSSTKIINDAAVNPTFSPDVVGQYIISLVVNDGLLDSDADTLIITVTRKNSTPIANAGMDQSVLVGNSVALNGSGSSDPDGDNLVYSWVIISKPASSSTVLSNTSTITPNFTVDVSGGYTFGLTVSDGKISSSVSLVNVIASSNSNPQIIGDGSLNLPFEEASLLAAGITNPKGYVKSTATGRIFDMRWGTMDATFEISDKDNISVGIKSAGNLYLTITPYSGLPISASIANTFTQTISSGLTSRSMQESWVDKSVTDTWSRGLNGKGVVVSVIDDFTVNNVSEVKSIPFSTDCVNIPASTVSLRYCPINDAIMYTLTHGQQVAMIISGKVSTIRSILYFSGPYANGNFPTTFLGIISGVQPLTMSMGAPILGVAFGSYATTKRDDYLTYQKNSNGLFDQLQKWGDGEDSISLGYKSSKVVNLSLGGTSSNPVVNKKVYLTLLAYAKNNNVPDAIFVKAAGNAGCKIHSTNCDPDNPVLYYSPNYKAKSIIVGALAAAGGSIASYSNLAGNYSSRFVVADGRGIKKSSGGYEQGTSFAAPRVSAIAAILRQKYPNMSASEIADIILATAKWNSAWGAKSATTQAIYGQGEVDLDRAQSPIGSLP